VATDYFDVYPAKLIPMVPGVPEFKTVQTPHCYSTFAQPSRSIKLPCDGRPSYLKGVICAQHFPRLISSLVRIINFPCAGRLVEF
jgi:hypothetical protein